MANTFDAWESEYLEHYGIPGMKWGVRRFQNKDGTLTSKGEKRYGASGNGGSARSMQRHFNKLDKGYANIEQRRVKAQGKVIREMRKANKTRNVKRSQKHMEKALKAAKQASEANKQKKAVESLQWRIIGKAAKRGYTTNSEAVTRSGMTGADRVRKSLGLGDFSTKVSGQNIKITRRGNGGTRVVNYSQKAVRAAQEDERRKRRNAQLAGAYR